MKTRLDAYAFEVSSNPDLYKCPALGADSLFGTYRGSLAPTQWNAPPPYAIKTLPSGVKSFHCSSLRVVSANVNSLTPEVNSIDRSSDGRATLMSSIVLKARFSSNFLILERSSSDPARTAPCVSTRHMHIYSHKCHSPCVT